MHSIKNKLSNTKENSKTREDIKELKYRLEQLQKLKADVLIESGILAYEKIRKNEIIDEELEGKLSGIKDIDKEMYNINIRLEEIEKEKELKCDCGTKLNINNKFCPECGKKVEIENTRICENCSNEVSIEYKFCVCCGNKL